MIYSLKLRKVTFINGNKTRNEIQRINSTTQSTCQVNVPNHITLYTRGENSILTIIEGQIQYSEIQL